MIWHTVDTEAITITDSTITMNTAYRNPGYNIALDLYYTSFVESLNRDKIAHSKARLQQVVYYLPSRIIHFDMNTNKKHVSG